MTARELLPDVRLGLVPAWPADLAEQARQIDQLSKADKTALLRQVMTRIPDLDTFAPFLLARLATGNPDEAVAMLSEAMSTGKADLAQRLTEVIKPPMNDGQAAMLAWSWMLKGQPKEALTALAQCGSDVSEIRTMRAQIIGELVASSRDSEYSSCTNLNSMIIPDGVTRIGDGAFRDCSSLTSITIPDSVTSIGNSAFRGCTNLTNITIPDSVTSIGNWVFLDCASLTSITIGNSVARIGDWTFSGCASLSSIFVATANSSYSSVDGVLFDKEKTRLIQYPAEKTNISYSIPDSVTSIANGAFLKCIRLGSITIPDSVISIGNYAFDSCSSLSSITIPDSVTSIGVRAFRGCSNLTSISVATANPSYSNIDGVLFDKEKTLLIQYPAGQTNRIYTIPDSVTSLGLSAFENCTSLTDITIPDRVTRIWNDAFENCTSLTSITIPDSVTSIGDSAFQDCTNLTSMTIPDSVTYIGNRVFLRCTRLTDITIGNGVTTIRNSAFFSCTSLTKITIPDSVTKIDSAAFKNCTSLSSIKFKGNGPISVNESVFYNSTPTIYRLSTATGWGDTFAGRPVELWDE